jgi:hypothetical protein
MKTISKILLITISTVLLYDKSNAQDTTGRKAFISVHSGIYLPSIGGYREMYHSHAAFINGIGLAIPFANKNFFFYAKGMYFKKTGTQIVHHSEYDNQTGKFIENTTRGGDITWRQLLANIGIQYNLNLAPTNNLMFNGGITLVKAYEQTEDTSAGSDFKGLAGFFLGAGYEKEISDKFSLFSEVQYNFDIFDIFRIKILGHNIGLKYGGANLNAGIRYWFNQK